MSTEHGCDKIMSELVFANQEQLRHGLELKMTGILCVSIIYILYLFRMIANVKFLIQLLEGRNLRCCYSGMQWTIAIISQSTVGKIAWIESGNNL